MYNDVSVSECFSEVAKESKNSESVLLQRVNCTPDQKSLEQNC